MGWAVLSNMLHCQPTTQWRPSFNCEYSFSDAITVHLLTDSDQRLIARIRLSVNNTKFTRNLVQVLLHRPQVRAQTDGSCIVLFILIIYEYYLFIMLHHLLPKFRDCVQCSLYYICYSSVITRNCEYWFPA